MKRTTGTPENLLNFSSRESLLKANAELIENLQKRINVKRFRPAPGESLKLSCVRVYIQCIQLQSTLIKDLELESLLERVVALEDMQGRSRDEEEPASPQYDEEQDDEYID